MAWEGGHVHFDGQRRSQNIIREGARLTASCFAERPGFGSPRSERRSSTRNRSSRTHPSSQLDLFLGLYRDRQRKSVSEPTLTRGKTRRTKYSSTIPPRSSVSGSTVAFRRVVSYLTGVSRTEEQDERLTTLRSQLSAEIPTSKEISLVVLFSSFAECGFSASSTLSRRGSCSSTPELYCSGRTSLEKWGRGSTDCGGRETFAL